MIRTISSKKLKSKLNKPEEQLLQDFFKNADLNKDGRVSKQEFFEYYKNN